MVQKTKHFLKAITDVHRWFFIGLALIMLVAVIWIVINNLTFLAKNIGQALTVTGQTPSPTRFDSEGFEKLNLIKPR